MSNHLVNETSPYLLQHVNNPVDWYPWGEEALTLSRQSDRPIFLSIGYSACHWCHVMEHESFENASIAQLMNDWFVCIKVDREERPDLDQIYMNAVQAMTGSGGWPMSVFLTPELKPFYGGTYWPPAARWGRAGFREILAAIHDAWEQRRDQVDTQAEVLTDHLQQLASPQIPISELGSPTLERAMLALIRATDSVHGGFGSAPKFPHPMDLRLGLRLWRRFRSDNRQAASSAELLKLILLTLEKMARGGIYDQLGGGFARYSTDERWLIPHFEKMLYDNAQLVPAYLEAYQVTGREEFAKIARETLDYILREMTQPEGGFYSTQDADSEGVEGKFFVWTEAQIDLLLNPAFAKLVSDTAAAMPSQSLTVETALRAFKSYYDVTPNGNWEHSTILNCPHTMEQTAKSFGLSDDQLQQILEFGRTQLFQARSKRIWPGRDDKVLVSWNGLMIAAMASGANVLGDARYAEAARAAADFILNRMIESSTEGDRSDSFHIWHCYKDGRSRFEGYLEDYAALVDGLCELYQAVFDVKYLDAAVGIAHQMLEKFWDADNHGFFFTGDDHAHLIARVKETHDNATPSGNSLAVFGLLKLARLTGRADFEEKAEATLQMMSGQLERMPISAGTSLIALDFLLGPTYEIVLAISDGRIPFDSDRSADSSADLSSDAFHLHQNFIPNKVLHYRTAERRDDQLPANLRELLTGKQAVDGQPTAYLCRQGRCAAPVVGAAEIEAALKQLKPG